ncbi:MAG: hypothetical protein AVDCRST_MAG20-450 [uncultured Acidimicrobiales bacterium]|uniref:Uncharacterized protein n=1 Tax=uncultured Acidimicrobiales bacterium TaxID=310071 RepID=A0A6J4H8M1_9ACTN|nr:MAG: hypothetical protein AVDCRST_MAG20-450 [uncultured Acidimicrobiales bacterium]
MGTPEEPQPPSTVIGEAMSRLHWELRDLFISSLQFGEIGTEAALRAHLATGEGLTPMQLDVVVAALNDGLLIRGDPFRI